MTTRGFLCMYQRSPAYPIQDDYASTNAVLRELESLLRTVRATVIIVGHHQE
jgi:hypothetical protein